MDALPALTADIGGGGGGGVSERPFGRLFTRRCRPVHAVVIPACR